MSRFAFSSAVYARNEGAILLVHHKLHKAWLPVGGEIEPGERPINAALRELHEETGLLGEYGALDNDQVVLGVPHGFLGYEEHHAGPKGWHGTFSFLFDVASRDVQLCDEHHEFMWFDGWASDLATTHVVPPNVKHYLTVIRHKMRVERAREATR